MNERCADHAVSMRSESKKTFDRGLIVVIVIEVTGVPRAKLAAGFALTKFCLASPVEARVGAKRIRADQDLRS